MAIISDFQEDENQASGDTSASSSSPKTKTFSGKLDRTNPLGFLEKVFEFVAKESDFLATDSSEKQVATVLRTVRERNKKRKAAEEEEAKLKSVKMEKVKEKEEKKPMDVEKEEEKKPMDADKAPTNPPSDANGNGHRGS